MCVCALLYDCLVPSTHVSSRREASIKLIKIIIITIDFVLCQRRLIKVVPSYFANV